MYVRIKRKKTTVFLHCEPGDTIQSLKDKLHALLDQVCLATCDVVLDQLLLTPSHVALPQQPGAQRLLSGTTILDDTKTLTDAGIGNDDVLALIYKTSGMWGGNSMTTAWPAGGNTTCVPTPGTTDGTWEDVDIEAPVLEDAG